MNLLSWLRRKPVEPALAAYLAATRRRLPRKLSLDAVRFVVIDAETTGFDARQDRILSLAAVPVTAGSIRVAEVRSWLLYQRDVAITDAVRVHGIMPADSRQGQPEAAVLAQLLPVISGAVLVGHHVGFDVAMLNAAVQRHLGAKLRNPTLDTAHLAMQVLEPFRKTGYPGQQAPSLEEICTHLDIRPFDRHTAEGDAFTAAELLMVLCAKLTRQLGRPLTVRDLSIG